MKLIQNATALILLAQFLSGNINAQSTTKHSTQPEKEAIMINNAEKNKEVVRQLYERVFNQRNLALADELISPEFTDAKGQKGAEAFKAVPKELVNSFPDAHWQVTDIIAENDKVSIRWIFTGTHQNSFTGIPVSSQKVSSPGFAIFHLKDQQVTGVDVLTDRLTFLQQLQVLPPNITSLNQRNNPKRVIFIDVFTVPAASLSEFKERVAVNRRLIEKMPGFIEDAAYEQRNENGNIKFVTIAQWASVADLQRAKETVQENYRKEGFDMPAMLRRLNITMDRNQYTPARE